MLSSTCFIFLNKSTIFTPLVTGIIIKTSVMYYIFNTAVVVEHVVELAISVSYEIAYVAK